ncbi:MAG TPA: hypothetical protein VFQ45_08080 [Longimicrobium sp.]|nr:hypothetical protein [Longimicrobium sp.]
MNTKAREVPVKDRPRNSTAPCMTDPFYRASSTLLARLAEAVDGHRKGKGVCFVGRYWYDAADDGHRLYGPFDNCRDAQKFWDDNELDPEEYGIFGPYYTKELVDPPGGEVREVVIRFKNPNKKEIVLNGDTHDAVFWKPAAVEKFALPYYMSIGSLKECQIIEQKAAAADVLAHKIGSGSSILTGGDAARNEKGIGLYGLTANQTGEAEVKLLSGGIDEES